MDVQVVWMASWHCFFSDNFKSPHLQSLLELKPGWLMAFSLHVPLALEPSDTSFRVFW